MHKCFVILQNTANLFYFQPNALITNIATNLMHKFSIAMHFNAPSFKNKFKYNTQFNKRSLIGNWCIRDFPPDFSIVLNATNC